MDPPYPPSPSGFSSPYLSRSSYFASSSSPIESRFASNDARPSVSRNSQYAPNNLSASFANDSFQNESRKDMLISDLRKQVQDLLRFKEQAINYKAQINVLEQKERFNLEESAALQAELKDRLFKSEQTASTLRSKIIQLEEERMEGLRSYKHQLTELQSDNSALRAELERKDIAIQKLEHELSISTKNAQGVQTASNEAAQAQSNFVKQIQDRLAELSVAKQELESSLHTAEKSLEGARKDARDKGDQLVLLTKEKEALERSKLDLINTVNKLQAETNQLEAKMKVLQAESNYVPELKKDLAMVPVLKSEIRQFENMMQELEEKLQFERSARRMAEEDRNRCNVIIQELERELRDLKDIRLEGLAKDLDREKDTALKLNGRIEKLQVENKGLTNEKNLLQEELTGWKNLYNREMKFIERLVDQASSGSPLNISFTRDTPISDSTATLGLDALASTINTLKQKLSDSVREINKIRDQNKTMESSASDSQRKVSALEQELESKKSFLAALCKQVDTLDLHEFSSPLNRSFVDSKSWSELQITLQEKISKLTLNAESLKSKLNDREIEIETIKSKLREKESDLAKALKENLDFRTDSQAMNTNYAKELAVARDDLDHFFHAVRLLIRAMRPLRVKIRDLTIQKQFLLKQFDQMEATQKQIVEIVFNMSPEHQVPYPRRPATFRAAAIAVIGGLRFLRLYHQNLVGNCVRVGRDRVNLGPRNITEGIQVIPSMPPPVSLGAEAEGVYLLMNHFDPTSSLEDQLYSKTLLYSLDIGMKDFNYKLESMNARRPTQPSLKTKFDEYLREGGENVHYLRQSVDNLTRSLRDVEMQKSELQRECETLAFELQREQNRTQEMEMSLTKANGLNQFLESKLRDMQQELSNKVPAEDLDRVEKSFEAIKRAHEETVSKMSEDREAKSKLQRQAAEQLSAIAELSSKVKSLQSEVEDRTARLKVAENEMKSQEAEVKSLRDLLARRTSEASELQEQKKKTYQNLLEAQTESKISMTEKKHLQAKLSDAEAEIAALKKKGSSDTSRIKQLEREREEDELKATKTRTDLMQKEREVERAQETIRALQEAHKKATERCAEQARQLEALQGQIITLRRELELSMARETIDRREREEV